MHHILKKAGIFLFLLLSVAASYLYSPLGLILVFILLILRKPYLKESTLKDIAFINENLFVNNRGFLYFSMLPLLFIVCKSDFFPRDDLIRHMVSYKHSFDYSHYYGYAKFLESFSFSPWFGFEWWVGHIHHAISLTVSYLFSVVPLEADVMAAKITVRVVSCMAFAWWAWIWFPLVEKYLSNKENGYLKGGFITICVLGCGLGHRFLQGRPEIFGFLAMLSVWRLRPAVWLALMFGMHITYCLNFIYALGVFFIEGWSFRKRVAGFIFLLASFFCVWGIYAGWGSYFDWLKGVVRISSDKDLQAGENVSIINMLASFMFVFIVPIIVCLIIRTDIKNNIKKCAPYFSIIALFMLTDQARYGVYSFTLLAYVLMRTWEDGDKSIVVVENKSYCINAGAWAAWSIIGGILLFYHLSGFVGRFNAFNTIKGGEWILTYWDQSTFLMPLYHPDTKVISSMDIRYADVNVRQAAKEYLKEGMLSCKTLDSLPKVTHIMDQVMEMRGVVPSCLQLQELQGEWRLWKVIRPSVESKVR